MKNIDFKNLKLNEINMEDINLDALQDKYGGVISKFKDDKPFFKKVAILVVAIIVVLVGHNFINNYQEVIINETNTKQSEYKEIESFLTKYNNEVDGYKKDVSKVSGQIIEFKDIDKANVIVTELANNNNLTVNTNNKKEKTTNVANNIFTQEIDMAVTGQYADIIKFLNTLENEKFFVSIDSVSIANGKDNSGMNTAKISYQIFFVKS